MYTLFKKSTLFILIALTAGCAGYSGRQAMENHQERQTLDNRYVLPQQTVAPPEVQSIQLYAGNDETAPPIITLNGSRPLTLEFDYLDAGVRQFRLTVSHRSKDWEESPIPPAVYLDSFSETYFGDGRKSFVQNPTYHHYTYRFPNERLKMTKSGNYLLSVFDNQSDALLFRIPFFVSEEIGELETRIETRFAQRSDGRSVAQPFSEYRYPAFVRQPQFDLSFMYAQNQFWGRARFSERYDTATPGFANFHLSLEKSFIADYEFNLLDLRSFDPDGRQIVGYQPGKNPPLITLRRDVQQFDTRPSPYPSSLGIPQDDRQAQYGTVEFSFEPASSVTKNNKLYIVGDFNNWIISPSNRMHYDSTRALWKGSALIKQGAYRYKYVVLRNNRIDDFSLDRMFTRSRQHYSTFVYFRDPERNFDRLLKTELVTQ